MGKSETIVNVSTIFNRGNATLAAVQTFFKNKNHDKLISLVNDFLASASRLIGNPKITPSQALNDHGVDIIVEFPDTTKIGIQIKSPNDVESKDFAPKVKAQMSESQAHGLDKWYLFICSPIVYDKHDFSMKIGHMVSELSLYKTSYCVVYTPEQVCNILSRGLMSEQEFASIRKQYVSEPVDWRSLNQQILTDKSVAYFLNKETPAKDVEPQTGQLYSQHLGMTDPDDVLANMEYLNDLRELLKKVPKKTRAFLYETLKRANAQDRHNQSLLVLAREMEHVLGLNKEELQAEVSILRSNQIAEFDNEQGDGEWYIAIRKTNRDYNILEDIREFSEKYDKSLEAIIIELDFSCFDK